MALHYTNLHSRMLLPCAMVGFLCVHLLIVLVEDPSQMNIILPCAKVGSLCVHLLIVLMKDPSQLHIIHEAIRTCDLYYHMLYSHCMCNFDSLSFRILNKDLVSRTPSISTICDVHTIKVGLGLPL